MKITLLLIGSMLSGSLLASVGVVSTPKGITVSGAIEGYGNLPPPITGNTIDYLTFEVTNSGPIRLVANNIYYGVFLAMGIVVEGEPFDEPLPSYLLFSNYPAPNPPEFTDILGPGKYLVQIAETDFYDGDLYPYGYLPVNRDGGSFPFPAPYSFTLEGSVIPLDFMEGNLDGTFTITHVPEPSTTALIFTAAVVGLFKRRDRRL